MPSIVYTKSDASFKIAVKTSTSIRRALLKLDLNETGSAYRIFKKRVELLGLDTSHFTGRGYLKGKSHGWAKKIPLNKILIKDSTYNCTTTLKERLLKSKHLNNYCYECELTDTWNGKPIVLQLDHINGIWNDNTLENLRILCPNCHSQTKTFAGKNVGGHEESRTLTDVNPETFEVSAAASYATSPIG